MASESGERKGPGLAVDAALAEERMKEALLLVGIKRFGLPGSDAYSELNRITDLDRLVRLAGRLLDVNGWEELLLTQ